MVCYARPASRLAALVIVAVLVFSRPVGHFFDTAALILAVTVAAAGAAVAAALVVAACMSARHRRAAAGGCVSCRFRCQHAMTEPARRRWLVTTADRGPRRRAAGRPAVGPGYPGSPGRIGAAPGYPGSRGRPGAVPGRSVPVLLPVPTVSSAGTASGAAGVPAPRWPDRPAYRASQVAHRVPAARARRRERAGSPA